MARAVVPFTGQAESLELERARSFVRLAADLATSTCEGEMLGRLVECVRDLIGAEHVTVTLHDASDGPRLAAHAGPPHAPRRHEPSGSGGPTVDAASPDGDTGHVRLAVDGEPIGTLGVVAGGHARCGTAELAWLEQAAALAGCCLERLRHLERLGAELARERHRASSLRTLSDIGERLQGALSEEEVVTMVAGALPQAVTVDRLLYARLTPDGAAAEVSAFGSEPLVPGAAERVSVAGSALGTVFVSGDVLLVPDLARAEWEDTRTLARAGHGSATYLPLAAGGRTVGVLVGLADAVESHPGELGDVLARVSRLAAAALERVWDSARRDRIEANLHQSRKLESLGDLAGGIAHDFNNLLQGVLGNASLALADLPAESPARLPVRRIETAAQHAGVVTSQLLAYAGRRQLRTEPVDLGNLVADLGDLIRATAGEGTAVRIDVPIEPCIAEIDPAQVRQLVLGLVENACEALGGGIGTVRVGVAEADETNTPPADAAGRALSLAEGVVLTVADDGPGMPAETVARVFEPFFTTKFAGRGLGLPWAMGVAQGHRGAIAIGSEVGVGTRVSVFFPRASSPPRPLMHAEAGAEEGSGRVVLVVDDNESVAALAARILAREGYEVLTATDGTAALEVFAQHGPQLAAVVLDVTMPGMSGDELFLELVEHGLSAPVIISSGFAAEDALQRFATDAVAGFLQKPYRAQELLEIVRSALGESGC